MSISLLSEALDIEKYVVGVVEVRVRVGIVDTSSAISGCGRGVRRQESRVMRKCECTALMTMIRVWPDADAVLLIVKLCIVEKSLLAQTKSKNPSLLRYG